MTPAVGAAYLVAHIARTVPHRLNSTVDVIMASVIAA
jgi:hypothetical protein